MKTLDQICDQAFRLYYETLEAGNKERAATILRIRQRYNTNINNLPEQQKLMYHTGNWLKDKNNQAKRCNIKYPREIYMA